MRPLLSALALTVAALVAAAPAAADSRQPLPHPSLFDVPSPSVPFRDAVLPGPNAAAARASASASSDRYPVDDGRGRTVRIAVTDACEIVCGAANPQAIASFLGTLVHGSEMSQLTVELVTPLEITAQCGAGALACYYSGGERMVISGNKDVAPDGATREYITAHEYGHHLANNRINPPFDPAIAWGTKRWGTYERVCQGTRRGVYYPGDQGSRYFENPGEAFAEAFAVNRFRNSGVRWAWIRSLKPNRTSLRQIRADALRPWSGRTRTVISGRLPKNGRTAVVKRLRTPLDGVLSLRLEGPPRPDFDLVLRDRSGRVLRRSNGIDSAERVNFTVCGTGRLRAVVKRSGRGAGRFRLVIRKP
jgi:hypothetical protein